jgi:hypothetical protein
MADLLEKIMKFAGPKPTLVRRGELPPNEIEYRIISADDHLIEPPDVFEGRMPARFRDAGPRVERDDVGVDYWIFEDVRVPLLGADGIKGWEQGSGYLGPVNFDEMHPAVYDVHERIKHMDHIGVLASL